MQKNKQNGNNTKNDLVVVVVVVETEDVHLHEDSPSLGSSQVSRSRARVPNEKLTLERFPGSVFFFSQN
jgi:hypothetical protein